MANARTDFFVPPFEMMMVWPHVTKKRDQDFEGKPLAPDDQYYDAAFFFPKTAASPWECSNYMFFANKLQEIIAQQPGWNGQWPGQISAAGPMRWPISDCDLTQFLPVTPGRPMPTSNKPDYLEKNPWAAGHWRISASSNYTPKIIDAFNREMTPNLQGDIPGLKGGDFVMVSLNAFATTKGTGGISFGFEGIKKMRDGTPIGGGGQRSVEAMFGAPLAPPEAPAPAYGAPPQYGAPAPSYNPPVPTPAPAPSYNPPVATPAPAPAYGAPSPGYAAPAPAPSHPYPSSAPPPPPPGAPVAAPTYGAPPVSAPLYGTR